MQRLDSLRHPHFPHLHYMGLKVRLLAAQASGSIEAEWKGPNFYLGHTSRSPRTGSQFDAQAAAHRRFGHRLVQVPGALAQHPVVKSPNDEVDFLTLAPLDGLVEVPLSVGNINPGAAARWPALLQRHRPALRLPRSVQQLPPRFLLALGSPPPAPTLLE